MDGIADVIVDVFPGEIITITTIIIIPGAADRMTGPAASSAAAMPQALTQVMRPASEMASGQAIITT